MNKNVLIFPHYQRPFTHPLQYFLSLHFMVMSPSITEVIHIPFPSSPSSCSRILSTPTTPTIIPSRPRMPAFPSMPPHPLLAFRPSPSAAPKCYTLSITGQHQSTPGAYTPDYCRYGFLNRKIYTLNITVNTGKSIGTSGARCLCRAPKPHPA